MLNRFHDIAFYAVSFALVGVLVLLMVKVNNYTNTKENEVKKEIFNDFTTRDKNETIEIIKEIERNEEFNDSNAYSIGYHSGLF